jgi:hypothetical protein
VGVGVGAAKLLLELHGRRFFDGKQSIMEIGSQELHVTATDFAALMETAGMRDYDWRPFSDLEHYPGVPRMSAAPFYRLLGLPTYRSIDVNEDYGAIPLDLNVPLADDSLRGQFDVVTDFGSAEHVFNVSEAYRSIHRLCRADGLIIAIQGFYRGNGYYLFDHSFFEGLAMANGYDVLFASFVISPHVEGSDAIHEQHHVPLSMDLLDTFDFAKIRRIEVCYVLRKTSDAEFVLPYQGTLMSERHRLAGYRLQFLPVPPARSWVPIAAAPEAAPAGGAGTTAHVSSGADGQAG